MTIIASDNLYMYTLFFHKLILTGNEKALNEAEKVLEELPTAVSVEKYNEDSPTWVAENAHRVAYFVSETQDLEEFNDKPVQFDKLEITKRVSEVAFQFPQVKFDLVTVSGLPVYWRRTFNNTNNELVYAGTKEESKEVYEKTLEVVNNLPSNATMSEAREILKEKLTEDEFNLVDLTFIFQDNVYLDETQPLHNSDNKTVKEVLVELTALQLQQVVHYSNPPKPLPFQNKVMPIVYVSGALAALVAIAVYFQQ